MKLRALTVVCLLVLTTVLGALVNGPPSVRAEPGGTREVLAVNRQSPGFLERSVPSGSEATWLSTVRRWDGAWLATSRLNLATDDWPYHLRDINGLLTAETTAGQFTQGKIRGAGYEFLPDRIKETIELSSSTPPVALGVGGGLGVVVPFSTTLKPSVEGLSVVLRDGAGAEVWRTAAFVAWDSSDPARTFESPVQAIELGEGLLTMRANPEMLAVASWPIYLDPTWTLSSVAGWGASTFQDAVEDRGDHNVKLGVLADNFDDNTNEQWTIEAGSATFVGGVMQLQISTTVRAGSSWGDQRIAHKIRFTQQGVATLYFRFQDASNRYFLEISDTSNQLVLKKTISGTTSTIASIAQTISTNTDYAVKVVAAGSYFEVWWANTLTWSGNDPSPPGSPPSGPVKFSTDSAAKVNVDDIRVWKSAAGTMTTSVRDAGSFRPLETKIVGSLVNAYDQVHLEILSSADNLNWGPWTNLKSDLGSGTFYKVPDQEQRRYYRLRVTLSSGTESTPFVSELTTNEGSPPPVTPTTNTGFESWYSYVAGRANSISGNLWYSKGDISVQGRGFVLAIVRSYNSLRGSETGALGNGWTYDYVQKLVVNGDTTVTWNDGDGSQHTFTPKGATGGYAPPRGVSSRLIKNGDATYTLWHLDGTRHWFTSAGRLSSLTDRNGNALTFTYDGSGRLTTVADDSGISLTLAYDASNRIQTVTDPLSRQITYGYTGSELTSVRDALGQYENYTYVSGKMSAIIDPIGKRTAFTYDGSNRVTEIWLGLYQGGGVVWQFKEYAIAYTTTTTRTITNARTYTTTVTLNSQGNPTQLSGPSIGCSCDSGGNSSSHGWDGEMNKIKVTDGRGFSWSSDYDHRSHLVARTDPGGNVSSWTYGETNTASKYFAVVASLTNFRGYTTTYAYDANGNGIKVTNARGGFAESAYDSLGFLNWSSDFRGSKTWYEYDTHRYLTKVTTPVNAQTQYGYDAVGRLTTMTAPGGHVTTTAYDAADRVVNVTDPLGNFTRFEYNARGDLTKVIDPNAYVTTNAYNVTNHHIVVATDALGNQTTYAYDARGNLASVKNARNYSTYYYSDTYDRQWWVTSPLGFGTLFVFDAAGNQISRTDAKGQITTYSYDNQNRLVKVNYPAGSVVTYGYDKNSNPTSEAGLGYTRTMTYDELDRVGTVTMAYGAFSKTTTYVYDPNGNQIAVRQSDDAYRAIILRPDANGGTVQWTPLGCATNWDCVDEAVSDGDTTRVSEGTAGDVDLYSIANFTAGTLPSGDSVISSVTVSAMAKVPTPCPLGPMEGLCWGNIRLRANSYESPILGVDEGFYSDLTYTWTTNPATGKRWTEGEVNALQAGIKLESTNTLVDVTQVFVTVAVEPTLQLYDAANRQTKIVDPEGEAVVFGYDLKSRRTSESHPNGVATTWTYDNADRVTKVETKKSDNTVLEKFEYTYDKAGNDLTMKDSGATTTYEYDKLYRLTKEITPSGLTTTYKYDSVGNRIEKMSGTSVLQYAYDADDRLKNETYPSQGWVLTFEYDANGNRIRDVDELGNPTEYTYDPEDRLTRVYYPNSGLQYLYTYASSGQRMSYASGGSTTYFGYDYGDPNGYEDLVGEYNSTGTRQARYTHGPGADEPVAVQRGGAKYRYHADALGSVTRITDAGQNTARSYRYDAWGTITGGSGTLANPYLFTSREKDSGSTLYYYRARMYDPAVGRFAGKDPAGMVDGPNLYAYAGNSPTNFVDPSGLRTTETYDITGFGLWMLALYVGFLVFLMAEQTHTQTRKLTVNEFRNCGEQVHVNPRDRHATGATEVRQIEGKKGDLYIVEYFRNVAGKPPFYLIYRVIHEWTYKIRMQPRLPPGSDSPRWVEGERDLPDWWPC